MSKLDDVAASLRSGGVAVIPTDTVYGVAAAFDSAGAVFDLKRRPRDKALPVLGTGVAQLSAVARFDDVAAGLAARAWPGPLTIVLPRAEGFTDDLGGTDDGTVAVRVPAHPLALDLLRLTGPLAVTSANLSGEPPVTTFGAARALFPDVDCLDGGTCDGSPSTVLGLAGAPEVFREGALSEQEVLGWVSELRRGS